MRLIIDKFNSIIGKALLVCWVLTVSILVYGCNEKKISLDELTKREGRWYKKFSNKPFSGSVETYNENGVLLNIGKINKGHKEGTWKYYMVVSGEGRLSRKGRYDKGLETGMWEDYVVLGDQSLGWWPIGSVAYKYYYICGKLEHTQSFKWGKKNPPFLQYFGSC